MFEVYKDLLFFGRHISNSHGGQQRHSGFGDPPSELAFPLICFIAHEYEEFYHRGYVPNISDDKIPTKTSITCFVDVRLLFATRPLPALLYSSALHFIFSRRQISMA